MFKMVYTKFEAARLLGARALQIKMGAPILIKVPKKVEKPLDVAKLELERDMLPITVKVRGDLVKKQRRMKVMPKIFLDDNGGVMEAGIIEESEDLSEDVE